MSIEDVLTLTEATKDLILGALIRQYQDVVIDNLVAQTEVIALRKKVSDIREAMSCLFCTEVPVTPVTTACGHTFCADCMARWTGQYWDNETRHCPSCRTRYRRVQPNFMLASIAEIL
jgi:hypothetical protein